MRKLKRNDPAIKETGMPKKEMHLEIKRTDGPLLKSLEFLSKEGLESIHLTRREG